MLDEMREYTEYMNLSGDEPRLAPLLFKDNQKGIVRALTIIARHGLFEDYHYQEIADKEQAKDVREKVFQKIRDWCFQENSMLQQYCEKHSALIGKDIGEAWKEFRSRRDTEYSWNTHNIYRPFTYNNSSQNATNFSIIIADAICQGPLKKRYLVCKKGFEEEFTYVKGTAGLDNPTKSFTGKNGKMGKKPREYWDRCLKYIAAYLLAADGEDKYIAINKSDLGNWMGYPSLANKSYSDSIYFFYKGEELFEKRGNKVRLNPAFREKYAVRLVEDDKNVPKEQRLSTYLNSDEYVIFEDTGAGVNTLRELYEEVNKKESKKLGKKTGNKSSSVFAKMRQMRD